MIAQGNALGSPCLKAPSPERAEHFCKNSMTHQTIAIAKIDFQIEAFSKAGQRPARTQPKAERERCLGLRTIINIIAPSGREKPRFVPYPEICFGIHYRALREMLYKRRSVNLFIKRFPSGAA